MDPTNYQGNSHREKEKAAKAAEPAERKFERIVTSEVTVKKQGPMRVFKTLMIEADMRTVAKSVFLNNVIPHIKSTILLVAEMTFFGQDRRPGTHRPPPSSFVQRAIESRTTYKPYESISRQAPDPRLQAALPQQSVSADDRGYTITDRDQAQRVLETFRAAIEQYDFVSVRDLHEMLGLHSEFTDSGWGWTSAKGAQIVSKKDGWLLELPQAQALQQ